jgi:hypothetical protein
VIIAPAIVGETMFVIGPAAITEIRPVGETTPAYLEAVEEFRKWAEAA